MLSSFGHNNYIKSYYIVNTIAVLHDANKKTAPIKGRNRTALEESYMDRSNLFRCNML